MVSKKDLKKMAVTVACPIYVPMLLGACVLPVLFERKITSQKELDSIVNEESKKLGLSNIAGKLHEKYCGHVGPDGKSVHVGGFEATRTIVRHELYHIYKQHNDCNNMFNYLFKYEPQAILYQYGLKV